MSQLMQPAMLAAAVLGLMAATAGQARAGTTVSFSYSGNGGPDNAGFFTNGTGSFSFASGLSTVGLADLKSFTFTMEESTTNDPDSNTITFGLADLSSFSASVDPGPNLTSLALATDPVQGSSYGSYPREFTISSLNPPDASTYLDFHGLSIFLTSGTITTTLSVPEPSTFILAVLGALFVAGGWSRHRKARPNA